MLTDDDKQSLIDLKTVLTSAKASPRKAPDPKTAYTAPAGLKDLPADVQKKITDRGAAKKKRATAVAKARTVVDKMVADALQRVEKTLKG